MTDATEPTEPTSTTISEKLADALDKLPLGTSTISNYADRGSTEEMAQTLLEEGWTRFDHRLAHLLKDPDRVVRRVSWYNDKDQFEPLEFDEWMAYGLARGWAGPPVCSTHDGIPTSEAEDDEFEEGDPCIHVIRLYEDAETKAAVEENHAPSVWRQPR